MKHMTGRLHDVTVTIRESMPVWPGDPGFERSLAASIEKGDPANVSLITMGSHVGTHVDAPVHFVPGASTLDEMPIDVLVGEAAVFELDVKDMITESVLETLELTGRERVLFKTRNSQLWDSDMFISDYVSFTPEAAMHLVDLGIKLVGIDYLSIGAYHDGARTHQVFLKNNVVVVEGLNLSEIHPGLYEIMCLPLKILGGDGAPARVFLREL